MKKLLMILLFAMAPLAARADAALDDILARAGKSLASAQTYCTGLPEQIDSVKTMAGISIAGTAVGTVGGGAATVTGFMKASNDSTINSMRDPAEIKAEVEALMAKSRAGTANSDDLAKMVQLGDEIRPEKMRQAVKDLEDAKNKSKTLGNIRTAGGFVAGAGGAVGAVTSFNGMKTLDDLIANMNACDSYVGEVEKLALELRMTAPDDPTLAKMDGAVKNCGGMSSKNIADVKGKMKAAGILSVVGGAAGIVGGVTSIIANKKDAEEQGNKMNTVSNISSAVATAGNAAGAILSGIVLSGLMKNGDIAAACADSF